MATRKVSCPVCNARMHNRKTNWLAPTYAQEYYTCSNPECSETAVYGFERQRTISPSGLTRDGSLRALLERLKPDERQMALDLLQGQAR